VCDLFVDMFVVLCVPVVSIGCINDGMGAPDHQYRHALSPAHAPQAQPLTRLELYRN
jgi:hypothetical protein